MANLKRQINARLKALNRQDAEQKYQTETKVNTVEERRAKLDTIIGRDDKTTSGIESLEVVQNSAGDVISINSRSSECSISLWCISGG